MFHFSAVMMPAAVLASVATPAGYLSMLLFSVLQHRKTHKTYRRGMFTFFYSFRGSR